MSELWFYRPHGDFPDVARDEQLRELQEHLATTLSGLALERAVLVIDYACFNAALELRFANNPVVQRRYKRHLKHKAAIAAHAAALRELLNVGPVSILLPFVSDQAFMDWPPFLQQLDIVATTAARDAERSRRRRPRGRPQRGWRDELIAMIFAAYPPGTATRTAGSHFETTVSVVLEDHLGQPVDDVHRVIVRALQRFPDPPYEIEFTRPVSAKLRQ